VGLGVTTGRFEVDEHFDAGLENWHFNVEHLETRFLLDFKSFEDEAWDGVLFNWGGW